MTSTVESPREQRVVVAGALGLLVLLVLPLMTLAPLEIFQGHEDLTLEWSVVGIGLLVVAAAQVATLVLLWTAHAKPARSSR